MKLNNRVMQRAWVIFRETYHYPSIPFASIGRQCFAWALRKAWAEVRELAKAAATPATERLAAIDSIKDQLSYLGLAMPRGAAAQRERLNSELSKRQSIEAALAVAA